MKGTKTNIATCSAPLMKNLAFCYSLALRQNELIAWTGFQVKSSYCRTSDLKYCVNFILTYNLGYSKFVIDHLFKLPLHNRVK
jgi:hypothetical protein